MAENKNLCEEIQIAILSDEALTDTQKKHIDNCEECKALLSQTESMKKDLGAISVPGLEEGRITQAVMQKIKNEKLSAPIPKFRLTHHLGTAAAVAIILSAALVIKNPSVDTSESAVVDNTKNSSTVQEAADESTQTNHYIYAYGDDYSDEEVCETEAPAESEEATAIEEAATGISQEEQPQLFKAGAPESRTKQSEKDSETEGEDYSDQTSHNYNSPTADEAVEEEISQYYYYNFSSYSAGINGNSITAPDETEESLGEYVSEYVPEYIPETEYQKPVTKTEPTVEAAPSVEAEPQTESEPFVKEKPQAEAEPESEPIPDSITEFESESIPEIVPESEEEPVFDSVPEIEPEVESEAEPEIEEESFDDVVVAPQEEPVSGGGSSGGSSGSSGGGGSSSSSVYDDTADTSVDDDQSYGQIGNIFADVSFLYGEENFDFNIALANALISEFYGSEYMLTRELLASMGCTTNADFISFIYGYTVA